MIQMVYLDFNLDMLFDALGIEPNREKLRYYILLDELFLIGLKSPTI